MKTLTQLLMLLLCAAAVSARAQTVSKTEAAKTLKPEISAEEVLEKHIEALGLRKAGAQSTSFSIKATMEMPARGVKGTMEIFGKAPDRLLTITNINGVGIIKQGYDGKVGWSQNPYEGLRAVEGDELEQLKQQAVFNPELKWRELYPKVELTGKAKVGEKEAYVLRLTDKSAHIITKYYDAATFLLLRADTVVEGPQGKFPIETHYTDYRDIGGIKV
jgi:hypothetical protein